MVLYIHLVLIGPTLFQNISKKFKNKKFNTNLATAFVTQTLGTSETPDMGFDKAAFDKIVSKHSISKKECIDVRQALERWSREFGPLVKVDQLVKEMIQKDETKAPFGPLLGSCLPLQTLSIRIGQAGYSPHFR